METWVWVNNLLYYCVALWIRVLLAELIVPQLVTKLSTFLCNPKVHYLVHKGLPPLPILNQINLVQFKNHFVLSFHLRLGHPSGFHAKTLYAFLFSPIRGTWPIFLGFITRKYFGTSFVYCCIEIVNIYITVKYHFSGPKSVQVPLRRVAETICLNVRVPWMTQLHPKDFMRGGVYDILTTHNINTGFFIMYSGIKKNYYRKTVGHVFKKPVQIEGTTQKCFS